MDLDLDQARRAGRRRAQLGFPSWPALVAGVPDDARSSGRAPIAHSSMRSETWVTTTCPAGPSASASECAAPTSTSTISAARSPWRACLRAGSRLPGRRWRSSIGTCAAAASSSCRRPADVRSVDHLAHGGGVGRRMRRDPAVGGRGRRPARFVRRIAVKTASVEGDGARDTSFLRAPIRWAP